MNIKPITNAVSRYADRSIDWANRTVSKAVDSKIGNTLMPENPTDIAKLLALISTTTKDGVNCYYYTTQSYNNERIPEDKRKFVAGIDLANGILNVAIQLTLGLFVNKMSDKWYERMFNGGLVPKPETVAKYKDKANDLLSKSVLTQNIKCTEENIKNAIKKTNKIAKGGFGVIAVLLVTQIIAKRVIVPFLSTPLAGLFKKYLDKKDAQKAGAETEQVQNQNTPAATAPVPAQQSYQVHEAFKGFEQFMQK